MRKAGEALNLTMMMVKTMRTKQSRANSMCQARRRGKGLPRSPGTTSSISSARKPAGYSSTPSPSQRDRNRNYEGDSEICPLTQNLYDSDAHGSLGPTDLDTRKWTPFTGGASWAPTAVTGVSQVLGE